MTTTTATPSPARRLDATVGRVADKAAEFRPARGLLTLLALPLYLAGALVALVWVAGCWLVAAGLVGWRDVNARLRPPVTAAELELEAE